MALLTGEANMADKIQDKALLKRVVFASLIGATVEWYDFFLYGTVAGIVFSKLNFPTGDVFISTMLAYTTNTNKNNTQPQNNKNNKHNNDHNRHKSMLI